MKEDELQKLRHSCSHVLAKAVDQLFKNTKNTIGPAVHDGFYYDFDISESITPEHFQKIEKEMKKIISQNQDFKKEVVSKEKALMLFKDNLYKKELIEELGDEKISIYYLGEDWFDLCRGPHVKNTGELKDFVFKINKVSGAYWRGDEKNKMLQRVYVYGFSTKQELDDYLDMLEEAKKRDHRKLGKELGLFYISDYSKGMPSYLPNGLILKNLLIDYWREVHKKAGYIEIETPISMNRQLWEMSGHWDHYKANMYFFKVEDDFFAIKPMNCPGGMLYYKENLHSYKEFPLRVCELGKVHRHEPSGTLNGLLRVRCFTQDDAHIFMLPEQVEEEIKNLMLLVEEIYSTFGLSYSVELSTMPKDHIGNISDWKKAEDALKKALEKMNLKYKINEGDGAFYGPKIDLHIKDSIGREWQCGTIQLDMQMPKRFDLKYIDKEGAQKEPIMIHRVIYGSLERMIAVLIENFAGAFPLWLSPVQIKILTINDNVLNYALKINQKLKDSGFRTELDDRNEKIGKKIRDAQLLKVPYMIIIGENEKSEKTISVRSRSEGDLGSQKIEDFINKIVFERDNKKFY